MSMNIKRILSTLIDFALVIILASMCARTTFLNPYLKQYDKSVEEYNKIIENLGDIKTEEDAKNYIKTVSSNSRKVEHYNLFGFIYYFVIYFLYFVIFQYFNKGQTLGKKLFKLKLVDKGKKDLSMKSCLLKSIFHGYSYIIGYGVNIAVLIISITSSVITNNYVFIGIFIIVNLISKAFELVNIIFLFIKGYTITDIISKTCVIEA